MSIWEIKEKTYIQKDHRKLGLPIGIVWLSWDIFWLSCGVTSGRIFWVLFCWISVITIDPEKRQILRMEWTCAIENRHPPDNRYGYNSDMTLLLVFYELDMSWLPLFWLDILKPDSVWLSGGCRFSNCTPDYNMNTFHLYFGDNYQVKQKNWYEVYMVTELSEFKTVPTLFCLSLLCCRFCTFHGMNSSFLGYTVFKRNNYL